MALKFAPAGDIEEIFEKEIYHDVLDALSYRRSDPAARAVVQIMEDLNGSAFFGQVVDNIVDDTMISIAEGWYYYIRKEIEDAEKRART